MKFYTSKDTIESIKKIILNKEKGLYLRFGDGDVNLANGKSDLMQVDNNNIRSEMIEAFGLNEPNILKSLPLHCKEYGLENGMFPGNHECDKSWADNLLNKVSSFWGGPFTEIYSPVALHFLASSDISYAISFIKFIKNNQPLVMIGNENVPNEIINKLFGDKCLHIKTPHTNSFNSIDWIEKQFDEIYTHNSYNLIITSMGCAGRVLQKRIYNKYDNIFIFDFGSLMDALCGWNTRAWSELTKFDKNNFLKEL